ncbi:hypothetical protein [Staphylococcus arlettae]|uniref:hypothetical protein n=1 Tax=Staphylococcus arlettae TaxID=29378 RepID=UPI0011A75E13|nr:hypothetical protein [Staphylococcus arlettae]
MTVEQNLITDLVYSAYEAAKEFNSIIVDNFLGDLEDYEKDILNGFHPKEIHTVKMDDAYFCDVRANTFVVMFGYDEYSDFEKSILVLANHKGLMYFKMFAY